MAEALDVMTVVKELDEVNNKIEVILKQLPTDEHFKIGELYKLIVRQSKLVEVETTKESGTMFLDRSKRVAQFLKREYFNARYDGKLRKQTTKDEPHRTKNIK